MGRRWVWWVGAGRMHMSIGGCVWDEFVLVELSVV